MSKQDDLWQELESAQSKVVSFMVRFTQHLWKDEKGEAKIAWRGNVKHVQGDEDTSFTDFAEGLSFMQAQLQTLTQETLSRYHEAAQATTGLENGLKFWEEATKRYTDLWRSSWEQGMEGAQQIKAHMDEAVRKSIPAWPELMNPLALAEENRELKRELEALKARIRALENTKNTAE
ncbi:MAG: hypothetical protein J0L94_14590 [Rhodothermia bacterium]|nr:hypothetical protein [Rhodothermia bacterium]